MGWRGHRSLPKAALRHPWITSTSQVLGLGEEWPTRVLDWAETLMQEETVPPIDSLTERAWGRRRETTTATGKPPVQDAYAGWPWESKKRGHGRAGYATASPAKTPGAKTSSRAHWWIGGRGQVYGNDAG